MARGTRWGAAVLALATATAGVAGPVQDTTWNKPHISYATYRADADECADTSRYVAVRIKPDTLARLNEASIATLIKIASDFSLTVAGGQGPTAYFSSMDAFRSESDIARRSTNAGAHYAVMVRHDVVDELQVVMDKCLSEKGYRRFLLTTEQKRHLARLKRHSLERDAYLYSLGAPE